MFLHYVFHSIDRKKCDDFFMELVDGKENPKSDPLVGIYWRFVRKTMGVNVPEDKIDLRWRAVLSSSIKLWNCMYFSGRTDSKILSIQLAKLPDIRGIERSSIHLSGKE